LEKLSAKCINVNEERKRMEGWGGQLQIVPTLPLEEAIGTLLGFT